MNQKVAQLTLKKMGHEVTIANNGQEACDFYDAGGFDLILMDCQMPVLDGYSATRRIRDGEASGSSRIPIIAMTAHAMQADRDRCIEAGMDDFVTKPAKPGELKAAIERCSQLNALPS